MNPLQNIFVKCITTALANDLNRNVTTIKIEKALTTLKQLHVKGMTRIYRHLNYTHGACVRCSEWRAASTCQAIDHARLSLPHMGDFEQLHTWGGHLVPPYFFSMFY